MQLTSRTSAFAMLITLAASGCALGPHTVGPTSLGYNKALQDTAESELLLNLVRARYGEQPSFVDVPNITQQYDFTGQATMQGHFRSIAFPLQEFFPHWVLGGTAAERPTIVVAPRFDVEFIRRLQTPISIDSMSILVWSGWSIDTVIRVTSNNINGLDNALAAGRPHPEWPAYNDEFKSVTWLLRQLQLKGQVELVAQFTQTEPVSFESDTELTLPDVMSAIEQGYAVEQVGDGHRISLQGPASQTMVLRFAPEAVGSPEHKLLVERLQLDVSTDHYLVHGATEGVLKVHPQRDRITLSRRSFLEVIHYLSQGIEVPCEHIESGIVYQTTGGDGYVFDWNHVTGDLIRVHVQKKRPRDAEIAIQYRDHWFYVDGHDLQTRYTLNLLLELYRMEVRGGGGASVPLITIGAGG